MKKPSMKKSLVIHPFLFAMFPALALYSHNVRELSPSELLIPLVASLGFALLLLVVSQLVFRSIKKSAIVASLILVLFFSYGYVLDVIYGWGIGIFRVGGAVVGTPERYLLLIWVILFACGAYMTVRTRKDLPNLTIILNVIAISLVAWPSVSIGVYELQRPSLGPRSDEIPVIAIEPAEADTFPDIYYIVLDTYPTASILEEFYDFDNAEFVDYLSSKGFYVASQSACNHIGTQHSLASSLNMEYLHSWSDEVGKGKETTMITRELIKNNKVWQFLKSKGYKYIHIGSCWTVTRTNAYADIDLTHCPVSGFRWLLYRSTMLRLIPDWPSLATNPRLVHRDLALYQFEKLTEIPDMKQDFKEPVFVFAHVVIPHTPIGFDRDGSFLTSKEYRERTVSENYLNQLVACNKLTMAFVDQILSEYSSSEVSPVIILQGDHGLSRYSLSNWYSLSEEDRIRAHKGILNAYHVPEGGNDLLYESITPVNTFRLVFNLYFGTNYELLSDRTYWGYLPEFVDVSDILKRD